MIAPTDAGRKLPYLRSRLRSATCDVLDVGHTDPAFTLRVYVHPMSLNPDERERLRALADGHSEPVGEADQDLTGAVAIPPVELNG